MFKKVALSLSVVLALFFVYVALQPSQFRIERTATIAAPPEIVFEQVNVMANRRAWYPWDGLDPDMQRTYGDIPAGVGATYAWKGNDDVGSGQQTIVESVPNRKVVDDLDFVEPFPAKNTSLFEFAPEGDGTRVTWAMEGTSNFVMKAFGIFFDMDAAVGKDFEKGLASLNAVSQEAAKARAEAEAKAAAEAEAAADLDDANAGVAAEGEAVDDPR